MAMAGPYLVTRYTVRYSPAPDPAWCRPRHGKIAPTPHGQLMPSRGRSLGTDHLLVFVADGAEPVMAGHNVELAAVFAHSNIAASEMTHV